MFVGRVPELSALLAAADRASKQAPSFVLVSGEAGVGKSRLILETRARLSSDGWRTLSGQCIELGAEGLPFAPLVDALRAVVASMPSDELDIVLGPARAELARLLPELSADRPASPSADSFRSSQLMELVLTTISAWTAGSASAGSAGSAASSGAAEEAEVAGTAAAAPTAAPAAAGQAMSSPKRAT